MPSIPKKLVMFDIDHIESVLPEFVTFAFPVTKIYLHKNLEARRYRQSDAFYSQ